MITTIDDLKLPDIVKTVMQRTGGILFGDYVRSVYDKTDTEVMSLVFTSKGMCARAIRLFEENDYDFTIIERDVFRFKVGKQYVICVFIPLPTATVPQFLLKTDVRCNMLAIAYEYGELAYEAFGYKDGRIIKECIQQGSMLIPELRPMLYFNPDSLSDIKEKMIWINEENADQNTFHRTNRLIAQGYAISNRHTKVMSSIINKPPEFSKIPDYTSDLINRLHREMISVR